MLDNISLEDFLAGKLMTSATEREAAVYLQTAFGTSERRAAHFG